MTLTKRMSYLVPCFPLVLLSLQAYLKKTLNHNIEITLLSIIIDSQRKKSAKLMHRALYKFSSLYLKCHIYEYGVIPNYHKICHTHIYIYGMYV